MPLDLLASGTARAPDVSTAPRALQIIDPRELAKQQKAAAKLAARKEKVRGVGCDTESSLG
jgi:hypothetical protein